MKKYEKIKEIISRVKSEEDELLALEEIRAIVNCEEYPETAKERLYRIINEWCIDEFDEPADFSDPSCVHFAFTTDPDTDLEIQIDLNLTALTMTTYYNGTVVDTKRYADETTMGTAILNCEFDNIVALTDEQKALVELTMKGV